MANKQRQLAASGTAAITDGNQVAFTVPNVLTKGGKTPIISVAGLATTETVSFYVLVGTSWKPLTDSAGNQIVFTATYCADTFNVAGVYGYIKDATTSAIALYITDGR